MEICNYVAVGGMGKGFKEICLRK